MQPVTGQSWRPVFEGVDDAAIPEPYDQVYPSRGLIKDVFLGLRNYDPDL